jgi:DNA invertase Pin-like site-specific DNA recombinase
MEGIAELGRAVRAADVTTALRAAARLGRLAEQLESDLVRRARQSGRSWQEIADCLGVTKQTAHRKYRGAEKAWHVPG